MKVEPEKEKIRHPLADVVMIKDFVVIDQHKYRMLTNYRDAFDVALMKQKYDPYLDKYDYLVGDVSSDKLRLKGFYKNESEKISYDKRASAISTYLQEYLNPGVAYFVLESLEKKKTKIPVRSKKHHNERKVKKTEFKGKKVEQKAVNSPYHQGFVIKKRKNSEA